ncbi:MAG: glyoxalase superfamily protein [Labrenzia sp.]
MTLPNLTDLKSQAKRLRLAISNSDSADVSHSKSLELVAKQYGYRDWNTLHAATKSNGFRPFTVGDRVNGTYLGQSFEGEILGFAKTSQSGTYRVTIQFDAPVDVVTFDSFSAYRSRVTCTIRENGVAINRTSDGRPHLVMDLAA